MSTSRQRSPTIWGKWSKASRRLLGITRTKRYMQCSMSAPWVPTKCPKGPLSTYSLRSLQSFSWAFSSLLGNIFSGFFPLMRSHTCLVLVLDFWFKGGFSFSWVTVDFFVQFGLGFDGFLMLCCLFGFLGSPFSDGTETWVCGIWWGPDVFDEIFFLLAVLSDLNMKLLVI